MTYAFIDSQNLNLGVQADLYSKQRKLIRKGWMLDFGKFRNYLSTKYKVKEAYLFIGYVSGNDKLYKQLQKQGFILVFKPSIEFKTADGTSRKGNVDTELVLHAMIELPNYDQAIIVSGDGDFYCLIEYLDKVGKLAKIITPSTRYSSLLRKYAKYIVNLDPLRKKLEFVKKEK